MGSGATVSAVCDAGPLIHLTEIGCGSLLRIFDTLHIPDAVWSETVGQDRVAESELVGLGAVQQHSLLQAEVRQFAEAAHLQALGDGELECLYTRAIVETAIEGLYKYIQRDQID